jgi:hypothetical protein
VENYKKGGCIMKRAFIYLVFGIILIGLQILSIFGLLRTGRFYSMFHPIQSSAQLVGEIVYFLGNFLIGIIGLILLIASIINFISDANKNRKKQ